MFDVELTPSGPYSLRGSLESTWSMTRRRAGTTIEIAFRSGDHIALARVRQRPDGVVIARIDSAADPDIAVRELRFVLAIDDDHSGFLAMAATDDLLSRIVIPRRGVRPVRTTVAQALLHGFAGQLITGREAWNIERAIAGALGEQRDGLPVPLSTQQLRAGTPPMFVAHRLAPRRARALAQTARTVDLDRLRDEPIETAVARLLRQPQIGPWTAGVVALRALGSYRYGIAGDLGLIRLCSNLLGRPATVDDTVRLLERYSPWGGLASLHLVRHPLAGQRS